MTGDSTPAEGSVWKILLENEAAALPAAGWTGTQMDQNDGFIHLSTTSQVLGTLNRFYGPPVYRVVLLQVSLANLSRNQSAQLKWEVAPDGAGTFPHLYTTLDPKTQVQNFWTLKRSNPEQTWDWSQKTDY